MFDNANREGIHEIVYIAEGRAAVIPIPEDAVDAATLQLLAERGVKLIALRSAGYNNLDLVAAARLGFKSVYVLAYTPHAVAELVFALTFALIRHLPRAYPGRQTIAICGDGGFTMFLMGDLLAQVERKTPVIHLVLNNRSLDFVNIEQQEAGYVPYGVGFKNPDAVRDGLTDALAHKSGPVVVDAVVDPYTLSVAKQVLIGRMDAVIKTMEHNVKPV